MRRTARYRYCKSLKFTSKPNYKPGANRYSGTGREAETDIRSLIRSREKNSVAQYIRMDSRRKDSSCNFSCKVPKELFEISAYRACIKGYNKDE